jgi:hypothetical protein
MTVLDLVFLAVELRLDYREVPLKLLVKATEPRVLQGDELVHMDQVVTKGHLMLLLSLIKVTINHLKDGILSIDLSIVVLLIDLHLLLELFGFCDSHDLTPVSEDLHSVEVCHFLLFVHCVLQVVPAHLHLFLFLVQVLDALILMPDLDKGPLLVRGRRRLPLHKLAQLHHNC